MKVENGKFYFIKDEFFNIFKGYKLIMENKENGNKRPYYFCFNNPKNKEIILIEFLQIVSNGTGDYTKEKYID